jgi:hypothetical protein
MDRVMQFGCPKWTFLSLFWWPPPLQLVCRMPMPAAAECGDDDDGGEEDATDWPQEEEKPAGAAECGGQQQRMPMPWGAEAANNVIRVWSGSSSGGKKPREVPEKSGGGRQQHGRGRIAREGRARKPAAAAEAGTTGSSGSGRQPGAMPAAAAKRGRNWPPDAASPADAGFQPSFPCFSPSHSFVCFWPFLFFSLRNSPAEPLEKRKKVQTGKKAAGWLCLSPRETTATAAAKPIWAVEAGGIGTRRKGRRPG